MDSKVPGLGDTDETGSVADTGTSQPEAHDASEWEGVEAPTEPEAMTPPDEPVAPEGPAAPEAAEVPDAPVAQEAQEEPVESPEPALQSDVQEAPAETEPTPSQPAEAELPPAPPEETGHRLKRGEMIEGTIIETSPVQVRVDIGLEQPGIVPGLELEKMTKQMLETLKPGAQISVYVVNPRDREGNAVLSINRALEELDWRKAQEFRESQEVYETQVAGYNKGGLIVRFGRLRGFVPQSQMSADRRRLATGETPEERWGRMVHEKIVVKVMEVDRSRNRLILSERSATRESREKRKENLINTLRVGEIRTGRVVSLEDFGAFVDIGGAEGLVHLTELSWKHVTRPSDLLRVGQEARVEVISIDREHKRIGLSMKSLEQDPWDLVAINYNVGQLVRARVTKTTKFGAFAQLIAADEIEGLIHISELSDKRVNHPRDVVQEGDVLTLRVVKMDIANRRLGLSLKKVNSPEYLDQDWAMQPEMGGLEDTYPTAPEPASPALVDEAPELPMDEPALPPSAVVEAAEPEVAVSAPMKEAPLDALPEADIAAMPEPADEPAPPVDALPEPADELAPPVDVLPEAAEVEPAPATSEAEVEPAPDDDDGTFSEPEVRDDE